MSETITPEDILIEPSVASFAQDVRMQFERARDGIANAATLDDERFTFGKQRASVHVEERIRDFITAISVGGITIPNDYVGARDFSNIGYALQVKARYALLGDGDTNYVAFPFMVAIGTSLICLHSEGEGHGNSDRQIMSRSDDGGLTWSRVTWYLDSAPTDYDNSLLDGLLSTGESITLKAWTIFGLGSGEFGVHLQGSTEARTNYALYSDDHSNAAWVKATGALAFGAGSVSNSMAVTDAYGTNTADLLVFSGDATHSTIQNVNGLAPNQPLTYDGLFKVDPGGPTVVTLSIADRNATSNIASATFALTGFGTAYDPVLSGNATVATSSIRYVGGGWYVCSLTATPNTSGTNTRIVWRPQDGSIGASHSGNGVNGIYVGRQMLSAGAAQVAPGNLIPTTTVAVSTGIPTVASAAMWSRSFQFGGKRYRTGYASEGNDIITMLFEGDEKGTHWKYKSTIANLLESVVGSAEDDLDYSEADIVVLNSGDWLAYVRQTVTPAVAGPDGRPIYVVRSTDDGATWGTPTLLTDIEGTQPSVIKLTVGALAGRVLLSLGDRRVSSGIDDGEPNFSAANVTGVVCYISTDATADAFGPAIQLAMSWSTDCGQPMTLEMADGDIVTTYYTRRAEAVEPTVHSVRWTPTLSDAI